MKQFLTVFSLILVFAFTTSNLNAQSGGESTQAVKLNPLALAFGALNASYEKSLGKSSFLIGASYIYKIFGVKLNTFGADMGYRYYITDGDMKGFYVTPKVGFSVGSSDDFSYNSFSIAAELGYQIRTDGGFIFDLGIGPAWSKYGGDYGDIFDATDTDGSGIGPSATLAIGYAF